MGKNKKQKKVGTKIVKLTIKDQVLYGFAYFLLILGICLYVPFVFLEDRIFLRRMDVFAFSETRSLFWLIPSMCIAAIGLMVLVNSEVMGRSFKQFLSYLFSTRFKRFLVILSISSFIFFTVLAVCSSSTIMKSSGIVEQKSFGVVRKRYRQEEVDDVAFIISNTYTHFGVTTSTGYVCYISLKMRDGKTITFQYFEPKSVLAIRDLYSDRIHFEGQENVEQWLQDLDCEEGMKIQIKKLFLAE